MVCPTGRKAWTCRKSKELDFEFGTGVTVRGRVSSNCGERMPVSKPSGLIGLLTGQNGTPFDPGIHDRCTRQRACKRNERPCLHVFCLAEAKLWVLLISSWEHAKGEQATHTPKLSCRGEGKHWANTHSYPIVKGSIPKAGHRSGEPVVVLALQCLKPFLLAGLGSCSPGLGQHRVYTLCPIVAKRLSVPHRAVIGTWAVKIQDDLANASQDPKQPWF